MSLFEDIVVICNVQSQRGLYGHFALFSTGTAAIPGTLWTQLWTMDSSAKADSFAHLQKSFAKIFCKNHSGNPHSKASAPNTNWRLQIFKWKRLPSPHRDILGKSSEKSFIWSACFLAWPNQCLSFMKWKNNQKCSHIISLTNWRASDKPKQGIHGLFKENLACVPFVLKLKKKKSYRWHSNCFPQCPWRKHVQESLKGSGRSFGQKMYLSNSKSPPFPSKVKSYHQSVQNAKEQNLCIKKGPSATKNPNEINF